MYLIGMLLAVPLAVSYHQMVVPRTIRTSTTATSLNSMGSDQLPRPDDEDSPEFKEYLRNLLKMQANRAKAGYASPSSGSSDAYVAKLNRLKMERNARIQAGLPDVPEGGRDTGYKDIDYKNAV